MINQVELFSVTYYDGQNPQDAVDTRFIKDITTRIVAKARSTGEVQRCELDSHADTCVAGDNTLLLHDTGKLVNVSTFSDEVGRLKNIPIACVGTM